MNPRYNAENGLVYSETTVPMQKLSLSKWLHHANGIDQSLPNSCPGARSLLEVARRAVIANRQALEEQNLGCVPWSIALPLWRRMVEDQLVSLSIWLLFAAVYRREIELCEGEWLPDTHTVVVPSELGFQAVDYFMKKDIDMITVLEVRSCHPTRAQWFSLCQMRTLRVLAVQNTPHETSQLDLSLIRAWRRNSIENGGFPNLRVLLLGNLSQVSPEWLKELTLIPSLRLLSLASKIGRIVPNSHMWQLSTMGPRTIHELALLSVVQLDNPGYEEDLTRDAHQLSTGELSSFELKDIQSLRLVEKVLKPTLQLRCGGRELGMGQFWLRRFAPNKLQSKRKDFGGSEGAIAPQHEEKKVKMRVNRKQNLENALTDLGYGLDWGTLKKP